MSGAIVRSDIGTVAVNFTAGLSREPFAVSGSKPFGIGPCIAPMGSIAPAGRCLGDKKGRAPALSIVNYPAHIPATAIAGVPHGSALIAIADGKAECTRGWIDGI